jgi:hypothetical protein
MLELDFREMAVARICMKFELLSSFRHLTFSTSIVRFDLGDMVALSFDGLVERTEANPPGAGPVGERRRRGGGNGHSGKGNTDLDHWVSFVVVGTLNAGPSLTELLWRPSAERQCECDRAYPW